MKIAVTGGSGAIGAYVCDELIKAGHQVVCLDRTAPGIDVAFHPVDLTGLEETRKAVSRFDQIVHLAAIPHPFGGEQPEEIIGINTVIAYNVFEAARLEQVRRVVYGCSESSTGFGIHHVKLVPEYVPIDEEHPLWPHETYSLSKHFGERIGANYARSFGMEVISLRYVWVWVKRDEAGARQIVAQAREGLVPEMIDGFGAHIGVRDVARACADAAAFEFPSGTGVPFEAFFLAARNTFYPLPTLQLLERSFGKCPPVRDAAYFAENPFASVFDIRKASRSLGWEPELDWHDLEQWEF